MKVLTWIWAHLGTELFVSDGKWCWDEWHAYWFGCAEVLGKVEMDKLPDYIATEQHYYALGRALGRALEPAWRDFPKFAVVTFWGLLFLAGVIAIGHLIPAFILKLTLEGILP